MSHTLIRLITILLNIDSEMSFDRFRMTEVRLLERVLPL